MSTLTNRSVTWRTGEEYGRKHGKLIVQQILRWSTEFSAGIQYVAGGGLCFYACAYYIQSETKFSYKLSLVPKILYNICAVACDD